MNDAAILIRLALDLLTRSQAAVQLFRNLQEQGRSDFTEEEVDASGLRADLHIKRLEEV